MMHGQKSIKTNIVRQVGNKECLCELDERKIHNIEFKKCICRNGRVYNETRE